MKKALITGITGQDGSYLTEHLLSLGYEVHGIVRRHSVAENQSSRLHHVNDDIVRHYGDLTDEHSLMTVVRRVQPDEIFGVTPANLFVVRNAGNLADDDAMGSLEYAVEHLSTSLIVVMGHTNCGAVKATEGIIANGGKAGGHIDSIVNQIKPNIQSLPKGHTLSDAVLANAKAETERLLSQSALVEEAVKGKDIAVVTATFDLATKKVTFVA